MIIECYGKGIGGLKIKFEKISFRFPVLDYRTGPCFTAVDRSTGICSGQLGGVICTKQLCCATLGLAWGHPCENCPLHLQCEKGYIKNVNREECVGE